MPEPIEAWWARRQWSRGLDVPYAVGEFRDAWASFPMLVRQYHPDLNGGIVLSQIPPAADVYLTWDCDAGHVFVATPTEQRNRPGRERRRSSWCPDCAALAKPRRLPVALPDMVQGAIGNPSVASEGRITSAPPAPPRRSSREPADVDGGAHTPAGAQAASLSSASSASQFAEVVARARRIPARDAVRRGPGAPVRKRPPRAEQLCAKTPDLPVGTPFVSACAPAPASAVEAQLRADLAARIEQTTGFTAIRLRVPFFDHLEAWPDILLPELRVALEYDSTGRHGLEHVGRREEADRRKDRAVRAAGWEVVRIRTGRLPALGPHDLCVSGVSRRTVTRIIEELRTIRGAFLVDAYLR